MDFYKKKCWLFENYDVMYKLEENFNDFDLISSSYNDGFRRKIDYFFMGNRKNFLGMISNIKKISYLDTFYVRNISYKKMFDFFIENFLRCCPEQKILYINEEYSKFIKGTRYLMTYHYFFRFGQNYFEKKFGFKPKIKSENGKNNYKINYKMRKTIIITKELIEMLYNLFRGNKTLDNLEKKQLEYYLSKADCTIEEYVNKINYKKVCHRFYFYVLERFYKIFKFREFPKTYYKKLK